MSQDTKKRNKTERRPEQGRKGKMRVGGEVRTAKNSLDENVQKKML